MELLLIIIVLIVLFGGGLIGFVSRRNMIVMFLSAEIMLQGVSLSLVAWSRFRNDFGGQMLVLFIIYMPKGILGGALEAIQRRKPAPASAQGA